VAKRKTLMDEIRKELRDDRVLNELYQRELAKLQLANQIAKLRQHAGLSQAELARRIGTKQAGVARMERSAYRGYTVGTLAKIAAATGARLEVKLVTGARRAS
jgi:ribosome-binding protein aMBF1 (putative translation factor)